MDGRSRGSHHRLTLTALTDGGSAGLDLALEESPHGSFRREKKNSKKSPRGSSAKTSPRLQPRRGASHRALKGGSMLSRMMSVGNTGAVKAQGSKLRRGHSFRSMQSVQSANLSSSDSDSEPPVRMYGSIMTLNIGGDGMPGHAAAAPKPQLSLELLTEVAWTMRWLKSALPVCVGRIARYRQLAIALEKQAMQAEDSYHPVRGRSNRPGTARGSQRRMTAQESAIVKRRRDAQRRAEGRDDVLAEIVSGLDAHLLAVEKARRLDAPVGHIPTDLPTRYWALLDKFNLWEGEGAVEKTAVTAVLCVAALGWSDRYRRHVLQMRRKAGLAAACAAVLAFTSMAGPLFPPRSVRDFTQDDVDPFLRYDDAEEVWFTDPQTGEVVYVMPAPAHGDVALSVANTYFLNAQSLFFDLSKLTLTFLALSEGAHRTVAVPFENLKLLMVALRAVADKQGAEHNFADELPDDRPDKVSVGSFFFPTDPLKGEEDTEEIVSAARRKSTRWDEASSFAKRRLTLKPLCSPSSSPCSSPKSPRSAPGSRRRTKLSNVASGSDTDGRSPSADVDTSILVGWDDVKKNMKDEEVNPSSPRGSMSPRPVSPTTARRKSRDFRSGSAVSDAILSPQGNHLSPSHRLTALFSVCTTGENRRYMTQFRKLWEALVKDLRYAVGCFKRAWTEAAPQRHLSGPYFTALATVRQALPPSVEMNDLLRVADEFSAVWRAMGPVLQIEREHTGTTPPASPPPMGLMSLKRPSIDLRAYTPTLDSNVLNPSMTSFPGDPAEMQELRSRIAQLEDDNERLRWRVEALEAERTEQDTRVTTLRNHVNEMTQLAKDVGQNKAQVYENLTALDDPSPFHAHMTLVAWRIGEYAKFCQSHGANPSQPGESLMTPPKGDVAICFTDIKSSTQLWEFAPEAMRDALITHNKCIRTMISRHKGYEVKTIGDAFMVAFQSARSAVQFALDVQLELVKAEWDRRLLMCSACNRVESSKKTKGAFPLVWNGLQIRIGINYGYADIQTNPVTNREDYFGSTVNKAARVEAAGVGGVVTVTDDVLNAVEKEEEALGDSVESLKFCQIPFGKVALKGVKEPAVIFGVLPNELLERAEGVVAALKKKENDEQLRLILPDPEAVACVRPVSIDIIRDENPETAKKVEEIFLSLVAKECTATNGAVVDDAVVERLECVFPTPQQACRFALNLNVSLLQAEWPELPKHKDFTKSTRKGTLLWNGLRAATGVHCGTISGDIGVDQLLRYGGTVIANARKMSGVAAGGLVLISKAVLDVVTGNPEAMDIMGNPKIVHCPTENETLRYLLPRELEWREASLTRKMATNAHEREENDKKGINGNTGGLFFRGAFVEALKERDEAKNQLLGLEQLMSDLVHRKGDASAERAILDKQNKTRVERLLGLIVWQLKEFRTYFLSVPQSVRRYMQESDEAGGQYLIAASSRKLARDAAADEVSPPEGTATIVFTDIQSSTHLWDTVGDAMRTALNLHNKIIRQLIRKHRGYEVKTIGDAFMVAFSEAKAALVFALEVQLELLDQMWDKALLLCTDCAPMRNDKGKLIWNGVRVRIGMHHGEVDAVKNPVSQRMDYFGPAVNKAARVEGSAPGGLVALTDGVLETLTAEDIDAMKVEFISFGALRLKGVTGETVVYGALPKAIAARRVTLQLRAVRPPSVPKPPPPEGKAVVVYVRIEAVDMLYKQIPLAAREAVAQLAEFVKNSIDGTQSGHLAHSPTDSYIAVFPREEAEEALNFALQLQQKMLTDIPWAEPLLAHPETTPKIEQGQVIWKGLRVSTGVSVGDAAIALTALSGQPIYTGDAVMTAQQTAVLSSGGLTLLSPQMWDLLGHGQTEDDGSSSTTDSTLLDSDGESDDPHLSHRSMLKVGQLAMLKSAGSRRVAAIRARRGEEERQEAEAPGPGGMLTVPGQTNMIMSSPNRPLDATPSGQHLKVAGCLWRSHSENAIDMRSMRRGRARGGSLILQLNPPPEQEVEGTKITGEDPDATSRRARVIESVGCPLVLTFVQEVPMPDDAASETLERHDSAGSNLSFSAMRRVDSTQGPVTPRTSSVVFRGLIPKDLHARRKKFHSDTDKPRSSRHDKKDREGGFVARHATVAFIEVAPKRTGGALSKGGGKPRCLGTTMREVLSAVVDIAALTSGVIVGTVGMCVMVSWNAEVDQPCPAHASSAKQFADQVVQHLATPERGVHVGLASGEVLVGTVVTNLGQYRLTLGGAIQVARGVATELAVAARHGAASSADGDTIGRMVRSISSSTLRPGASQKLTPPPVNLVASAGVAIGVSAATPPTEAVEPAAEEERLMPQGDIVMRVGSFRKDADRMADELAGLVRMESAGSVGSDSTAIQATGAMSLTSTPSNDSLAHSIGRKDTFCKLHLTDEEQAALSGSLLSMTGVMGPTGKKHPWRGAVSLKDKCVQTEAYQLVPPRIVIQTSTPMELRIPTPRGAPPAQPEPEPPRGPMLDSFAPAPAPLPSVATVDTATSPLHEPHGLPLPKELAAAPASPASMLSFEQATPQPQPQPSPPSASPRVRPASAPAGRARPPVAAPVPAPRAPLIRDDDIDTESASSTDATDAVLSVPALPLPAEDILGALRDGENVDLAALAEMQERALETRAKHDPDYVKIAPDAVDWVSWPTRTTVKQERQRAAQQRGTAKRTLKAQAQADERELAKSFHRFSLVIDRQRKKRQGALEQPNKLSTKAYIQVAGGGGGGGGGPGGASRAGAAPARPQTAQFYRR